MRAALIYQHASDQRSRQIADGLGALVEQLMWEADDQAG